MSVVDFSAKIVVYESIKRFGFIAILLAASIPNPVPPPSAVFGMLCLCLSDDWLDCVLTLLPHPAVRPGWLDLRPLPHPFLDVLWSNLYWQGHR
jgi:hypothetical protein